MENWHVYPVYMRVRAQTQMSFRVNAEHLTASPLWIPSQKLIARYLSPTPKHAHLIWIQSVLFMLLHLICYILFQMPVTRRTPAWMKVLVHQYLTVTVGKSVTCHPNCTTAAVRWLKKTFATDMWDRLVIKVSFKLKTIHMIYGDGAVSSMISYAIFGGPIHYTL